MRRRHITTSNVRLNNIGMMIFQAAKTGDVEALNICLQRPEVNETDLSYEDEHGQTPLTTAAIHGHLVCVKTIIAHMSINAFSGMKLKGIAKYAPKRVATYLKLCKEDLRRFKTTRAHMEREVGDIAGMSNCTAEDIRRFTSCLDFLVKECGYILDGNAEDCNWIVRATSSNNIPIVTKLVEDYKASLHARAPQTLETTLHLACRLKSPLRYYIATKCPSLLLELDAQGDLPLHTACQAGDNEFISWLFQVDNVMAVNTTPAGVQGCTPVHTSNGYRSCNCYVRPQCAREVSNSDGAGGLSNDPYDKPSDISSHSHIAMHNQSQSKLCCSKPAMAKGSEAILEKGLDATNQVLSSEMLSTAQQRDHEVHRGYHGEHQGDHEEYQGGNGEHQDDHGEHQGDHGEHQSDHGEHQGDHGEHQGDHGEHQMKREGCHNEGCHQEHQEECHKEHQEGCHKEHQEGCHKEHQEGCHKEHQEGCHKEHQEGCHKEHQEGCHKEHQEGCHKEHQEGCHTEHQEGCQALLQQGCQTGVPHQPFAFPRNVTDLITVNSNGHSAVHIAVAGGYITLLTTLVNIISKSTLQQFFNASIFISRNSFPTGTPVDLAIINSQRDCLRLLLRFFDSVGLLKTLSLDDRLLKTATFIGDTETVKLLIEFGISAGLEQAISQAIANNFSDIQRLLLFYYTQLTNLEEVLPLSVLPSGHQTGEIRWKGIAMEQIRPEWLTDSYSAIASVHKARREESVLPDDNSLQRYLGARCLTHFANDSPARVTFQTIHDSCLLVAITSVEVCESSLTSVPPELFQMPHLSSLTLAHNSISGLPSALSSPQESVYTCRSLKKLVLDDNQLSVLPEDLFLGLVCTLEELSVQRNRLTDLPPGLWVMPHLKTLRLSGNMLCRLHYFCSKEKSSPDPDPHMCSLDLGAQVRAFYHTLCRAAGCNVRGDFNDEAVTSQYQHALRLMSEKVLADLEESVCNAEGMLGCVSQLSNVDLSFNRFSEIPRELPCIAPGLQRFNMRHNVVTHTNLVSNLPASVTTVNLDNNQIESTTQPHTGWECGSCWMTLYQTAVDGHAPCQHKSHDSLQQLVILTLGSNQLKDFVIGEGSVMSSDAYKGGSEGTVPQYTKLYFPQLSILELPNNALRAVPRCIYQIDTLNSLDLSFNVSIQTLPRELGLFKQDALSVLKLDGLTINGIPEHLLHKSSPRGLINYLRTSLLHSQPYRCIKLMLMGSVRAGKTTLLQQLTKRGTVDRRKEVEMGVSGEPLSTVGVDLGDWVYRPQKGYPKVTFMTWDFGGQEEYYATHQCFLSDRSLYLVVWDVTQGEKGLESIKPWLENIEARAPGSPVIVVGTHGDCIRQEEKKSLEKKFEQLYVNYNSSQLAYPSIEPSCQFVDCFDVIPMNHLRNYVYDKAMKYRKPGIGFGQHKTMPTPLLEEPVPMSFIKLHHSVRSLAKNCRDRGAIPLYHKEEYYNQVEVNNFLGKSEELEEATNFLHQNGILLHYEDSQLSDLYFIDPQWLCTMLAKVITIQEKNPYQKNGLMLVQDLDKIFTDSTTKPFIKDLVKIMQKFEVLLLLDEQHLLIPSLLPPAQELSCVVSVQNNSSKGKICSTSSSSSSLNVPHVPIPSTPSSSTSSSPSFPNTLVRYQFLPFIPNGFFSRLIARVVSGPIQDQCSKWLTWPWPMKEGMSPGGPHWYCWRSGVKLVWNNVEILKMVPVDCPLPGCLESHIISSQGQRKMELLKAIMIVVRAPSNKCTKSPEQVSAWVLQQCTHNVASVFDDWYEQFGRNGDIRMTAASPCCSCKLAAESACDQGGNRTGHIKTQYLFPSPYCALMVAERRDLECPLHGKMSVADIAPDLVFRDFVPSMVFDSRCVTKNQSLGEGGFGAVFAGCITEEHGSKNVAVKEFIPSGLEEGDGHHLLAELTAWEIYQNASQEARVMCSLNHGNILRLLGVSLAPIQLLLELAPLGDLKACVKNFQQAKVKLSRATLQATMIQVAEALDYLHSQNFIYRDLKPGNVLVWKFPLPETQWTGDQAVQLKLADYGICQQFTPQGVRGMQGTPPYLPPEVLLHGGLETYSTKLDVYSFGMFMYYLFTFTNPFEKETRSVASLLDTGRRPELLPKHHPGSLWMIELMCWCWSEKPQHRPTFQEILRVLHNSTLMKLLSAHPVTQSHKRVIAACTKLCFGSPQHPDDTSSTDTLDQQGDVSVYLEVWCGCDGHLEAVQYLPTGIVVQVVETFESRVSCVCVTASMVWVSAIGTGVHVYSAATKRKVARWEGAAKVFKLVFIEHTSSVLALTPTAVHSLPLPLVPGYGQSSVQTLVPQVMVTLDENLAAGTMATVAGGNTCEVWLVSAKKLLILDGRDLKTIRCLDHTWRRVRHMETLTMADKVTQVVIADEHYLEKWSVSEREKVQVFNCHDACKHQYGDHTKQSRITSLLSFNGLLYVGTEGGIIITLEALQLTYLSFLQACSGPSTCLLGVKPALKVRSIARLFSLRKIRSTENTTSAVPDDTDWRGAVTTELPGTDNTCGLPVVTERSLVVSFGRKYRGPTSSSENCQPFLSSPGIPSGGSPSGLMSYLQYLNPQPPNVNHIFLWSADTANCSGKASGSVG